MLFTPKFSKGRLKKATTLVVSLGAALFSSSTMAQTGPRQISYDYVGVKYVNQNLDQFDCHQDGLNIHGSMDLNSGWYAQASFTDVSGDNGCGSSTVVGQGGYRTAFDDRFYMYGQIGIESVSVDAGDNDSGIILAGGLRGFVKPKIEAQFELSHHTVAEGETLLTAMGYYWFAPNIAGTLEIGFGADTTAFGVGARMNF